MPTPVKTASIHTNFGKAEFRTRKIIRDKVGLHVTIKGQLYMKTQRFQTGMQPTTSAHEAKSVRSRRKSDTRGIIVRDANTSACDQDIPNQESCTVSGV